MYYWVAVGSVCSDCWSSRVVVCPAVRLSVDRWLASRHGYAGCVGHGGPAGRRGFPPAHRHLSQVGRVTPWHHRNHQESKLSSKALCWVWVATRCVIRRTPYCNSALKQHITQIKAWNVLCVSKLVIFICGTFAKLPTLAMPPQLEVIRLYGRLDKDVVYTVL